MNSVLDLLWLRVPPIRYVSPPACVFEASGSGSSGPIIVIDVHPRLKVTGLRIENCTLFWDDLPADCNGSCPSVFCYNVYRSDTLNGAYEIIAECVDNTQFDIVGEAGCFRVSAITSEGESDLSEPVCTTFGCAGCGDIPRRVSELVWNPTSGFPAFDNRFSLSGDSGNFLFTGTIENFPDRQGQADICNPSAETRNLVVTINYHIEGLACFGNQIDVWSNNVPEGTFHVSTTSTTPFDGQLIATLPILQGFDTIYIRVRGRRIGDGTDNFSGTVSIA